MPDETPAVKPAAPEAPADSGMRIPLTGLDVAAFFTELFAFFTIAFWGFVAWPFPWNIVVGIAAPALGILLWALFVSPRAVFAVHPFVRAFVELMVYASATVCWWSLGATWVGLGFAVVAVAVGVMAGRRRIA